MSPKNVAIALVPDLCPEQVEWDHENVNEWAYVDLPEVSFSLNVTRDQGMSDVDDDELERGFGLKHHYAEADSRLFLAEAYEAAGRANFFL